MNKYLVTFFFTFLLFALTINAKAAKPLDDFDVINYSSEKAAEIWDNFNLQKLESSISNEWMTGSILNFDISDKGIVIALEGNKIVILDEDGNVENGFSFHMVGTYGVHWNGENIVLFQTRGDLIFEFTVNAQLVRVLQMNQKVIENYQLRDELTGCRQIKYGRYIYQIKNTSSLFSILASQSFQQLARVDEDRSEELLYDAGSNQNAIVLAAIIVFLLIAFCVVMIAVYKMRGRIVP